MVIKETRVYREASMISGITEFIGMTATYIPEVLIGTRITACEDFTLIMVVIIITETDINVWLLSHH